MEYTILNVAPIVLLPFFAFVINSFIVKRFTNTAVWLSVAAIATSFIFSARIFCDFVFGKYSSDFYIHKYFTWFDLSAGSTIFKVDLGIYIDNMTAVMLLMVTGVATLIHIFSTFYMHDDARYGRFFVYLSLFTSAMLGLVLSDNLLSVFIFWELMGFCSYSLIGFYYEKEKAGYASIKAFMTTRVGDVFFLLGILAIWAIVGNVTFVDIYAALANGKFTEVQVLGLTMSAATFAGIGIFLGTIGKSAQFPLQVWLPDAMMGPTPCSALIHAATMVAAGVYLSLRMHPLLEAGNLTVIVAYIGAITAFGAATIALVQTDIKAVLAYSTISQLGYMVMGIGVGAYNAAFMHLITHAVFKACLFLAAGSVIHSLHDHHTGGHVQEMTRMGGLRKKLPWTHLAMLCCSLAIAGIPLFSGFVSKDRILGDAFYFGYMQNSAHFLVPTLGFAAAFLTAFYMFRMMNLTFYGKPKDHEVYEHCHEEHLQLNSNIPLLILSVFTLGLFYSGSMTGQGFIKVFPEAKYEWFQVLIQKPELEKFKNRTKQPLTLSVEEKSSEQFAQSSYTAHYEKLKKEETYEQVHHAHVYGAILSVIIAFSGVGLAFFMYYFGKLNPAIFVRMSGPWYKALQNKYYMDNLYIDIFIQKGLLRLNNLLAKFDMGIYDRFFIDGWEHVSRGLYKASNKFDNLVVDKLMVDGTGFVVGRGLNKAFRSLQTGRIQTYIIVLIVGLASYVCFLKIMH